MRPTLFISGVQKELQAERRAVADFVRGDALLRRCFDVFLFEDLPATDRRPDDVYLDEVARCAVYVGIFGNEYGQEDADGLSATEREFDRATKRGKFRLVFVKGTSDKKRHPKMLSLIRRASRQLTRRRFTGIPELMAQLYASLVQHLEEQGLLRTVPFDAAACRGASLRDISDEKLRWFLREARLERQYALAETTPAKKALAHLNLLADGQPTHAAILLFGHNPQRFAVSAEIKCLHFHGTEVRKPIPSYQIYKGTVFDHVDQAVDFVLSKLNRSVEPQDTTPASRVEYELPFKAVREAIVNAVAHRDYTSNAAVQVMLFADRLEVWNPGELPPGLTPDQLRIEHPSIPHNPLICDPMFLAHYAEKAGTGTLDMIALCQQAGLPAPDYEQRAGQFVTTIWRDWLTDGLLEKLGLPERQRRAIAFVKAKGSMTSAQYQQLAEVSRGTAIRDMATLVANGLLLRRGEKRGAHYVLRRKGAADAPNGPSPDAPAK